MKNAENSVLELLDFKSFLGPCPETSSQLAPLKAFSCINAHVTAGFCFFSYNEFTSELQWTWAHCWTERKRTIYRPLSSYKSVTKQRLKNERKVLHCRRVNYCVCTELRALRSDRTDKENGKTSLFLSKRSSRLSCYRNGTKKSWRKRLGTEYKIITWSSCEKYPGLIALWLLFLSLLNSVSGTSLFIQCCLHRSSSVFLSYYFVFISIPDCASARQL